MHLARRRDLHRLLRLLSTAAAATASLVLTALAAAAPAAPVPATVSPILEIAAITTITTITAITAITAIGPLAMAMLLLSVILPAVQAHARVAAGNFAPAAVLGAFVHRPGRCRCRRRFVRRGTLGAGFRPRLGPRLRRSLDRGPARRIRRAHTLGVVAVRVVTGIRAGPVGRTSGTSAPRGASTFAHAIVWVKW
ncbi:MAG TPA: hypothetical protein VHB25_09285 [Gemmatimonadaceae bacterium]|nr:hypothetical protein [Gemmatimonadaceae bacterium]